MELTPQHTMWVTELPLLPRSHITCSAYVLNLLQCARASSEKERANSFCEGRLSCAGCQSTCLRVHCIHCLQGTAHF